MCPFFSAFVWLKILLLGVSSFWTISARYLEPDYQREQVQVAARVFTGMKPAYFVVAIQTPREARRCKPIIEARPDVNAELRMVCTLLLVRVGFVRHACDD